MNYKLTQLFVVKSGTSLKTTGTTTDLAVGQLGVYDKNYNALAAAPTLTSSNYIYIAQGSGNAELGSFRTSPIYINKVTKWTGESADTSVKQQITYIGYDEVEDSKSPTLACDEEYTVTLRIDEHFLKAAHQPRLTRSFRVKTACCTDCASGCDSIDCKEVFQTLVDDINNDAVVSKYVTASLVSKCTGTPATKVFALTLPDPGTNVGGVATFSYTTSAAGLTPGTNNAVTGTASASGINAAFDVVVGGGGTITSITLDTAGTLYVMGETITIAGAALTGGATPTDDVVITVLSTTGAEGVLLDEVKTLYGSFVADTDTDIVITADTDADQDSNSTGNIRIELTGDTGVVLSDLEDYNGIKWEEVTLSAGTEACTCGVKLTGKALDEFGNDCVPDAVPYIANLVRFKAYVFEGPATTMEYEVEEACDRWAVTTTQEVKYAIGAGSAISELERHLHRNNLPYDSNYPSFWSPIFNDEKIYFTDTTKTYDIYHISYYDAANKGFENRSTIEHEAIIAVDSTDSSWKTAFETIMNNFVDDSPAYQGNVNL